ncbi:MAG: hypothetical protein V3U75_13510 [Methylococcaceae bacterium]
MGVEEKDDTIVEFEISPEDLKKYASFEIVYDPGVEITVGENATFESGDSYKYNGKDGK